MATLYSIHLLVPYPSLVCVSSLIVQANLAFGCFVSGFLRPGNVRFSLHTNADHIALENSAKVR